MPASPAAPSAGTNLSIVVGTIAREPVPRSLPTGEVVVSLELRIDGPGAVNVPVAWSGPLPAGCIEGGEVLVVGEVRRRFFRSGGVTQSRTEVVAHSLVPTRQRAKAARAVAEAVEVVTTT